MAKETMKAVIFKGPHEVAIEDRPVPKIQDGKDIIVKVEYSALCGRYVECFSQYLTLVILSQVSFTTGLSLVVPVYFDPLYYTPNLEYQINIRG
jgi:hypothetical protein